MTAPVVVVALLFWACVFMIYFTAMSTTPSEFFLGRYEPPPADLGSWKGKGTSREGLLEEERYLMPEARAGYLLQQVRYRDPVTRQIVQVDAERRVPRRRVSSRGA